jgi:hypothetical protein
MPDCERHSPRLRSLMENPWGRIDSAPRKKIRAFQRNREVLLGLRLDNL